MRFLFELIIYFTIFSFCGWVSETTICSFSEKKFVKRGFLVGPFIPVYGFGGLLVVILLAPLKFSPVLLYIVGVILVTALEYFTAVLMESIFSIKLWDYSQHKFNLHGRIWLVSSLFFGFLGLFGVYVINPLITPIITSWSNLTVYIVGGIVAAYFISDTITSTKLTLNISSLLDKFHEISHTLQSELEAHLPTKEDTSAELQKRYNLYIENKKSRFGWLQIRILSAYPNLRSKKHDNSSTSFKEYVEEKIKEKINNRKNTKKTNSN